MPTVTLNKNVVEKMIGKKLSLEKLKDRISYLGTDLEDIDGNEITVEVFPNRPDLLSEQGLGRALASFCGGKKGLKKYDVKPSGEKLIVEKAVKKVRPFTSCAIVKGLKLDDEKIKEIMQIQEKLHISYGRKRKKVAIGIYPMEAIAMPITYTAMPPKEIVFRPLEGDREMNALQMLEEHPAGRTYGHLLEGLDTFPVFLDSEGKVLSVPPIINSHETGKIVEETTDVFVETSGHDFDVVSRCLNMIVCCLADMGGKIFSMQLMDGGKKESPDLSPHEMELDVEYVNQRLGLELKEGDVKSLLEKMGYGVNGKKVLVPAYRCDVLHQVDLIEDIAIAYGYEHFEEEIPHVATIGSEDAFGKFVGKISTLLVGLGLLEAKTYHLTTSEMQRTKMDCDIPLIELENPSTQEYAVCRGWVVPSLMEVLMGNKHHEYPQKLFDVGSIFQKGGKEESGVAEFVRLGLVLAEDHIDYTKIRQVLDYIIRSIGAEYTIEEVKHNSFLSGRVGRVVVEGVKVGYVGEIKPKVLDNFGLEVPVGALEINLTELFSVLNKDNE